MKLVITIDTEEDNWGDFRARGCTLRNIQKLGELQDLFDEFHAAPTYLVTYPVATDEKSAAVLKGIADRGRCEIGAHCHPWNTPPFEEVTNARNSMLCNLPADLQRRKIAGLHDAIVKSFGVRPRSFRAGRWGYGAEAAAALSELGYEVDTSVIAFTDWRRDFGPDYSHVPPAPYRFTADKILKASSNGGMLEVPASVGYLQDNYRLRHAVFTLLASSPINKLRLIGLLNRTNILNKAWLSPENSDGTTMIRLAKQFKKDRHRIVNLFFHSSSLLAGNTPFNKAPADGHRIFLSIREFLSFAAGEGIETILLRDAAKEF